MSTAPAEPSEEEMRAYEEQLSRITTTEIAVQTAASLLSVGGRRLGLSPGAEHERDLEQARDAIDGVRALLPIVERRMSAAQARPLRDALSQLQMAYARLIQAPGAPGASAGAGSQGAPGAGSQGAPGAGSQGGATGPTPAQQGGGGGAQPAGGKPQGPGQPGPAESSGRLWVPGR